MMLSIILVNSMSVNNLFDRFTQLSTKTDNHRTLILCSAFFFMISNQQNVLLLR